LLLHNFRAGTFYGINPAFWSIAVEFQLYLLYPLLLVVVQKWGWRGALGITGFVELVLRLLATVWDLAYGTEISRLVSGSPLFFWFDWAAGAALAAAFLQRRPLPFARLPVWIFPGLFLAAFLFRPLSQFAFPFAALAAVNLLGKLLETHHSAEVSGMPARYLARVGVASYSIYLIHLPLLAALLEALKTELGLRGQPLVGFAACLLAWPFVVVLGECMYLLVERPSVSVGKKLLAWCDRLRPTKSSTGALVLNS